MTAKLYGATLAAMTTYKLVRRSDPTTSHAAAQSLDLGHPEGVVEMYGSRCYTDLEMAELLVAAGLFKREESARRAVRTCREEHGLLEPVISQDGKPVLHRNSTGRYAQAYRSV